MHASCAQTISKLGTLWPAVWIIYASAKQTFKNTKKSRQFYCIKSQLCYALTPKSLLAAHFICTDCLPQGKWFSPPPTYIYEYTFSELFIIRICHSKLTFILTLAIEFGEVSEFSCHSSCIIIYYNTLARFSGLKYCLCENSTAFWSSLSFCAICLVDIFLFCGKVCKNCQCLGQIVEKCISSDWLTWTKVSRTRSDNFYNFPLEFVLKSFLYSRVK